MASYKFDDCVSCKNRKRKHICNQCDFGEFFEDGESIRELSFDEDQIFDRANKSLVTEDDEPHHNPDDLIRQVEETADEEEADSQDE